MYTFWAKAIDRSRLMQHVTRIASYQRLAGSAEEAAAFDDIAQTLDECGLAVTRHLHKAFISLPGESCLIVGGQSFACRTHSHAANCKGLNAPIVTADKTCLTPEACKGRMVMLAGRAEREPLLAAASAGAVGVIFVPGDVICESCVTPVWGSPEPDELTLMPTVPVVSVDLVTAASIAALIAEGRDDAFLSTACTHAWLDIPLLEAEVRATRRQTDDFVMFSAHVDSWYHGATDNATANSVLLEVGRVAALHADKLERNLRLVFFSGHSQGRYAGSAWYADTFWEDLEAHCVASVNADVLGGIGATDITRAAVMPELRQLVADVVRELTGETYVGSRYGRFADQSFWGCGVSCALASFSKQPPREPNDLFPRGGNPGMGWWWHTPDDTLDKVDPANFERDAAIFCAVVMTLATATTLPLRLSAAAAEAVHNLLAWQACAGEALDLGVPLLRAETLREALIELETASPEAEAGEAAIDAYNARLRSMARPLVRLNYTCGNPYKNDPAIAQPPMPALAAIPRLVAAGGDEREALLVALKRGRTFVAHSLQTALNALA